MSKVCISLILSVGAMAHAVTIVPDFQGEQDWTAERKRAFNFAASQWQSRLSGTMQILVRVRFDDLQSGRANCRATTVRSRIVGGSLEWLPIALHGFLTGNHAPATEFEVQLSDPNDAGYHISIVFDRDTPWFLSATGQPNQQVDFITTAIHELAHGLGFYSRLLESGQYLDGAATIYEKQLGFDNWGFIEPFTNITVPSQRQYFMMSDTCDSMYWVGWSQIALRSGIIAAGLASHSCVYGGYPAVYTPIPWEQGSSISHLARSLEPHTLLAPGGAAGNETVYRYIPLAHLAMLDLGWEVAAALVPSVPPLVFIGTTDGAKASSTSDYVVIQNNSSVANSVLDLRLRDSDSAFQMTLPALPLNVPAYSTRKIALEYQPTSEGRHEAWLEISALQDSFRLFHVPLIGYASHADNDLDGLKDLDEQSDLDPLTPGVQNPFAYLERDSTGSNFIAEPDGATDGENDFDGEGILNRDEFATGLNPIHAEAMQTVSFGNSGNWPLRIDSYEIVGAHAGDYLLAAGDALAYVAPGEEHELQVVFRPSATGARTAALRIHYHDGVAPGQADVPLSGTEV